MPIRRNVASPSQSDTRALTSRVQNAVSRLVSVLNSATWLKLVIPTSRPGKNRTPLLCWPRQDLDAVAARIGRSDERARPPSIALIARAPMHRPFGALQFRRHRVQVVRIGQVQPDRLIRRIAFEIHQRMVTRIATHFRLVAAEIRRLALARR